MNEFKESYRVEREDSGKIIMTDTLKEILIDLLKGNISKKDVMNKTGIGDKQTIEIRIQEMVASKPELKELYEEYIARKSKNFNGYNFRAEAIEMLQNDYSQSQMAEKIGINRRSFSTKIKKLEEENSENQLGELLREHSERKMKRQELTSKEKIRIQCMLDEYLEDHPVGITRYESRNPIEVRLETITRVLKTIEELLESGMTLKQLSEERIISEASYRKYKEEAKNLEQILNGRDRKEE